MPPRDALVEHCLELLSVAGRSSAQRMFGGHGLRVDGVFVALIAFERLYLKTDEHSRPQFAAAGCEPFVYPAKGKAVTMSYWTVPPQAMESPEQMRPWARLALDAALRAVATKRQASARRPHTIRRATTTRPPRGKA
jgi:DNA transformation protein